MPVDLDARVTLGGIVRRHREHLGLSQEKFGAAIGVTQNAVSWWERDLRDPEMGNWVAMVARLGLDPWMLGTAFARILAERAAALNPGVGGSRRSDRELRGSQ